MTVQMRPVLQLTAYEGPSSGVDAATNDLVTHNGFNLSGETLNASSTPPLAKCSYRTYTFDATGIIDIDLTALLGLEDVSQDCTGLKVQVLVMEIPGSNTVGIGPGPSNGYNLFGAGNTPEFGGGYHGGQRWKDTNPDVSPTAKILRLTGTDGDTVNVGLVLG